MLSAWNKNTDVYGKGALAPMNKFVCKLHGYIVYLDLELDMKQNIEQKMWF